MLSLTGMTVLLMLAQTETADPSQRAAAAAERAAAAAERAAAAAQAAAEAAAKAADRSAPPAPVAMIAPSEVPAAPSAASWAGTVGLSLISLTGNASTLTANANAAISREWRNWGLSFKAFGTYGQARASGETTAPDVLALAAGGQLRGDRKVSEMVSIFLLAGAETNHVKSVEVVGFGEAGTGITWWDVKEDKFQKALLRTDLSARFAREARYQYYPDPLDVPDVDLLGPRLGVVLRYALSREVIFTQEAEVLPNILGPSRVLFNATTKLAARLTEALSLTVAFALNHDSAPAPGKVPTDTALSAGLEVAL